MAGFAEYRDHDALSLAELIRSGELSRVDVLDAAIERLEAWNPKLNAVIYKDYRRARTAAASGTVAGPFAGVPFLVKDTNDYAGTPSGWGSKVYQDAVAEQSDTLTARLDDGGFNIFGRTNVPEFALVGTTESTVYGPCRNPFDLTLTAGGSSGGAAAVVAAGIVPAAQASDGGGSIRCPASACGVYGLKPTRARTPAGPIAGEGWQGMLQQHVCTRTVRDSAAILDLTEGPEVGDAYSVAPPERPFLDEVGRDPGSLKIALMTSYPDAYKADAICVKAAEDAAKLCESLGHKIEVAVLPIEVDRMFAILGLVCTVWTRTKLLQHADRIGRAITADDVEPVTWEMFNAARDITANQYYDTIQEMHHTGRVVGRFFEQYDALITPALASLPVKLGVIDTTTTLAQAAGALAKFCPFTTTFNVTGQPAASIPLSWSPEGIPVGVQLVTKFGDDAGLIRLSAQLEAANPWMHHYERIG